MGGSKNARRTAMVHFYFNLIGSILFLIGIYAIQYTVGFSFWDNAIDKGGIANFHTLFNLTCTVLFLPFTGLLVNNMYYWATNQSIIQRSLGGKNLAESQKGAIWAGFFKCLDVFVIVLPGIIAFQLLAANGQMDTSVGMAADQAYPLLVMKVLPADGLLCSRYVRRDPVLVQLGAELRIHHLHPERLAAHLGQAGLQQQGC